jgi:polyhydroxybutyrate depolymerase
MERYSRFNPVAAKEGFCVVYPEAIDGNWNDGRGIEFMRAHREKVDDVKFLRTILDELARERPIDRGRVFATGMSNGGIMSHYLAIHGADWIAGIAPVAGGMTPQMVSTFPDHPPISLLIVQGDADPLIPFRGGPIAGMGGKDRGRVIPTDETLALYLKRNAITGKPTVTTLDHDPKDGTSVEIQKFPDGTGGFKTTYILVKNGGHTWPGSPPYLPRAIIGVASQELAASEAIWDFFKSCPPRPVRKESKDH